MHLFNDPTLEPTLGPTLEPTLEPIEVAVVWTRSPSIGPITENPTYFDDSSSSPTATPSIASVTEPQSEMSSSMIYGFNLFMAQMSGSPILDIDHLDEMIESYSIDDSECLYSALGFSQSFDSFWNFAEKVE